MKQNFRRGGVIISVSVLALITVCFSSCSGLAIHNQTSTISFTLPSASGERAAFGPDLISSYIVGINSDNSGDQAYKTEAVSGQTIEAELSPGNYTVIILALEKTRNENGNDVLIPVGIGKQSKIEVAPNTTTEAAIRIVPLDLNPGTGNYTMPVHEAWTLAKLPSVAQNGYIFNGWHTPDDSTTILTEFPDTTDLNKLTLVAGWAKEGVGDYNASGEYFISVTGISDDETWHSGKWEDPIPLNQLPDYLPDGNIPSGTILFLQSDLSGLSSLNALFNVIQEGVVFDGNFHTVTLDSISLSLPISCDYFIRNLTIKDGTGPAPLFSINPSGSLKLYNCTISNFAASGSTGGAIYNQGRLEFGDSTIANCSASSGGGIYCVSSSFLSIYGATITDCTCTGGKGASIFLEQNVAVNEVSYVTPWECWLDENVSSSTSFDIWSTFQRQAAVSNHITSQNDLMNLVSWLTSENNTTNLVIYLDNDITVSSGNWTSSNGRLSQSGGFAGTFDGQGHTITFEGSATPLFHDIAATGVIKNLGIKGNITSGSWGVGSPFCLTNNGTIVGCYFNGTVSVGSTNYAFGGGSDGTVIGCLAEITSGSVELTQSSNCQSSDLVEERAGRTISSTQVDSANQSIVNWNNENSANPCSCKFILADGAISFAQIN